MPRKPLRAEALDLSPNTRAVVTFTPSNQTGFVTFVRGNQAFTLSDSEARNLLNALRPERAA